MLALDKVTWYGSEMLDSGDCIMTCSYSSTLCRTVAAAAQKGKMIEIIAAESVSLDGVFYYGELTAQTLRKQGIAVGVIHDRDIAAYISNIDKVLVGADSILADGSLINGIPTGCLAREASGVTPFYVVCDTAKLDPRSDNERLIEPGFEHIPAAMITGIITEEGMIEPGNVTGIMERKWR